MRTVAQYLARDSGLQLDPNVRDNKIETFVNDAYDVEFQLANVSMSQTNVSIFIYHVRNNSFSAKLC